MKWETPSFVEITMDSEIGSYQDDFGNVPDATEKNEQVKPQDQRRSG